MAERDGDIRPVRLTSGRALTYVMPETASQILCQTFDKGTWAHLLGGSVGRHPSRTPEVGCLVAGQNATVAMTMRRSRHAFAGETTVGGRPASLPGDPNNTGHFTINVALTDDSSLPSSGLVPRDLLELGVIGGVGITMTTDAKRELAIRVLDDLVPSLAKAGDSLPEMDGQGKVGYVRTPLVGGGQIVDLPQPVQVNQLCTALQEAPGIHLVPTHLAVDASGRCQIQTATAEPSVTVSLEPGNVDVSSYSNKIAGRPARRLEDKQYFRVRLRDDTPVDLVVSAQSDAAGLAEKLVPLLLNP